MTKSALKTLYTSLQASALLLAASLPNIQQAKADELTEFKSAKPYTLEIRYGSLDASTDPLSAAVSPEFLEQAESLLVGVNVPESSFAVAGPLTFAYKLTPHKNPTTYILEYVGELRKTDGRLTLRSTLQLQPNEWIFLGGTRDTVIQNGQPVNKEILLALRLSESVP